MLGGPAQCGTVSPFRPKGQMEWLTSVPGQLYECEVYFQKSHLGLTLAPKFLYMLLPEPKNASWRKRKGSTDGTEATWSKMMSKSEAHCPNESEFMCTCLSCTKSVT